MVRVAIFSAARTINTLIPDDIQALIDENSSMKCGWTMKLVCQYYFEWSYLIDMENEVAIKYNNLYEPIIKLFERGGRISYHQSEFICGSLGWPRICKSLPRKVFINEISDKILDNIDLEYK